MRAGALAATGANVLLLTFFILQSFQSPFGRRHLAQISKMMDMQRQVLMAAEENFKLGNPSAESYFKPWIKKDLSTWSQEGIALVSTPCCSVQLCALPLDTFAKVLCKALACWTADQANILCFLQAPACCWEQIRNQRLSHRFVHVQEQVDEIASRYKECFGEVFRFQILNSTLWVDHISERHNGWYPASSGPGDAQYSLRQLESDTASGFCKHLHALQCMLVVHSLMAQSR